MAPSARDSIVEVKGSHCSLVKELRCFQATENLIVGLKLCGNKK